MFCPKCGSSLPDGVSFCGNCGSSLSDENATANPKVRPIIIATIIAVIIILIAAVVCAVVIKQSQSTNAENAQLSAGNAQAEADSPQSQDTEAARTIEMPRYTLVIPEYWVGKVYTIKEGDEVFVVANGGTKEDFLVSANAVVPQPGDMETGDIINHRVDYASTSDGYRAELLVQSWGGNAALHSEYTHISESLWATNILLGTGGTATLDQIWKEYPSESADGAAKFTNMTDDYIKANVKLIPK